MTPPVTRWEGAPAPHEAPGDRRREAVGAVDAARARLATIALPPDIGLRRDHIVPPSERGPDFDDRYDFLTLVYDAVHLPDARATALVCPRLLNLERIFRSGDVRLDDRPLRPRRIMRYRRYDVVLLPSEAPPATLTIAFDGWRSTVDVPAAEAGAFVGRNCLMTLSRDNRLRWIRDWAAFHVREHGADAVLFFDNGSTDYGPDDILAELSAVEGLAAVRVVSVDAPYGGIPVRGSRSRAMFLQSALWNVARLRFLPGARAVLACDVDELLLRRGGRSVFDATVASWGGFVKYGGAWRTHDAGPDRAPLHRDHVHLATVRDRCASKYCIVPAGRLRRHGWNTHGLNWLPFSRAFDTDEFAYLHCRGITTHWKSAHSRVARDAGAVDGATEALMQRHFGADGP